MPVNNDKPRLWKADIAKSVDLYNDWFMNFAPEAYRKTRIETSLQVEQTLVLTQNLTDIAFETVKANPGILPILRMCTAPPIARDRLIGLCQVSGNLVRAMELRKCTPPKMKENLLRDQLQKIAFLIMKLVDKDIFPWLADKKTPTTPEIHRAATVVADRLCGAVSDPIIRNAQEKRQLAMIKAWLEKKKYKQVKPSDSKDFQKMAGGTFAFHLNIPVQLESKAKTINIPVDAAIMPHRPSGKYPLLIETKSAGDFTNTNKRRKEEAAKISQLRKNYGEEINLILFLCGYFDTGYLGYEAAEGLDWIWEHRINDMAKLGL